MNSIEIKDFSYTLKKYILEYNLPAEVKRLVLKELYEDITALSQEESINQAKEREDKNA